MWVKPYMVNYQGKFIGAVKNMGAKLTLCVLHEVWFYTGYNSQYTFLPQSMGK